jgi:type II secretory pathway pseudopilin PulG
MDGSIHNASQKPLTVHEPGTHGVTRSTRGFTLTELMILAGILAVLSFVILPTMKSRRHSGRQWNCVNNLRQIGLAFRIWAGDNQGRFPMEAATNNWGSREFVGGSNAFPHFRCMSNELNDPRALLCSHDDRRDPATNFNAGFNDSHVSYFVGVDCRGQDQNESNGQMIIVGERNLSTNRVVARGLLTLATNQPVRWTRDLHNRRGNLLQTDGSLLWNLTDAQLTAALAKAGRATNRLVLP